MQRPVGRREGGVEEERVRPARKQFRAEAFNATNTYNYYGANWNNSPNSSGFGTIAKDAVAATASGFPRQVQLGLKLVF